MTNSSDTTYEPWVIGLSGEECHSIVGLLDCLPDDASRNAIAKRLGKLLESFMGIEAELLAAGLLAELGDRVSRKGSMLDMKGRNNSVDIHLSAQ